MRSTPLTPPRAATHLETRSSPVSETPAPSTPALSADDPRGVGPFEFLMRLGQGRTSTVYLAHARAARHPVAVKLMHEFLSADAQFVEGFLDEALAAELVRHANVVPVYEVGVDGEALFTVMDYVEGDTLAALCAVALRIRRSIPLGVVLRVALDALEGLEAAHTFRGAEGFAPVVHRDVSAQNILVGVDGVARVSDFGIASAERAAAAARQKPSRGRATFRAPHALEAAAPDPRVDVFAMGATLWEAIALRKMFPEHECYEHAARGARATYRNLRDLLPSVPAGLDAVVRKAVAHEPARRYTSAAAFAAALEDATRDAIATRAQVAAFVASVATQKLRRERELVRTSSVAPAPQHASDKDDRPAAANDVSLDDDDALLALVDALEAHGDTASSVRLRLVPAAPEALIVDEPVFDVDALERMSTQCPELIDAPTAPPPAGYDVLANVGGDAYAWNSALRSHAERERALAEDPEADDDAPREPLWCDDADGPDAPDAGDLEPAAPPADEGALEYAATGGFVTFDPAPDPDEYPRNLARYPALASSIDDDPYRTREMQRARLATLSFVLLYALARAL